MDGKETCCWIKTYFLPQSFSLHSKTTLFAPITFLQIAQNVKELWVMLKGSKIEVSLNVGAEELVSAVWRVAKATPWSAQVL